MEQELALASKSSMKSLKESSEQLQQLERGFGPEITTIRELNDPQGGNSFNQKLNQIRQEKRAAISDLDSAKEQKVLLEGALANTSLVTSRQLLEMQPALSVMMGSLNTARQQLSIDEGRYTSLHPALKASREAVRHQEEMLFKSLEPTIVGVDSQIAMAKSKVERLDKSIVELEEKLLSLTEQRVPYAKLQEDVMNKSKVHNEVQAKLSQVRSYTSSAENIRFLTRVGEPQVGSQPNGLNKKALILVGLAGGLLVGLGLVALAVPPSASQVAYQSVMMPVGGVQTPALSNNSFQPARLNKGPSPAPPASTAIVANTPVETVSESRLRSVAHQEQTRKQTSMKAEAKSGSASSVMSDTKGSEIPDSVAKHMADLKNKKKAVLTPTPPNAPSTPPAQQAKPQAPAERPKLSSKDVISAFKAAQTKPADKTGATQAVAAMTATDSSATNQTKPKSASEVVNTEQTPPKSIDSIKEQLRELDASEAKSKQKAKLRALNPTIVAPDIVVLDRKKTLAPEVPDSVAAGRITAESLIESSAKRVQGETGDLDLQGASSAAQKPLKNIQNSPVDTSILQRVKAELEDSNNKPAVVSSPLTPSNSDYAPPLKDAPTNQNSGELQDPSDSTLPMERRSSNVRPVDIAKSLAEHDSVRGIVDDIRPNESDASSKPVGNQRANEATIPSSVLDNSLVGLMREARKSNPNLPLGKSETDASAAELKPTSKTGEKPPTDQETKPDSVGGSESETIPQQIGKLSDSISSFARPTDKNSGPKET